MAGDDARLVAGSWKGGWLPSADWIYWYLRNAGSWATWTLTCNYKEILCNGDIQLRWFLHIFARPLGTWLGRKKRVLSPIRPLVMGSAWDGAETRPFFPGQAISELGKLRQTTLGWIVHNHANHAQPIWVCLKIGYIPNYSHLIGSLTIGFRGTLFSDKPICLAKNICFLEELGALVIERCGFVGFCLLLRGRHDVWGVICTGPWWQTWWAGKISPSWRRACRLMFTI